MTALVPSTTACLASSPGRRSLTAVWTSLDERVFLLLYLTSLEASAQSLSKRSLMNEFMMLIDLLEIPVCSCTCLSTLKMYTEKVSFLAFLCFFMTGAAFLAFDAFPDLAAI